MPSYHILFLFVLIFITSCASQPATDVSAVKETEAAKGVEGSQLKQAGDRSFDPCLLNSELSVCERNAAKRENLNE